MVVDSKQFAGPMKRIGTLRGQPVMEAVTKGGFHLIVHQGKPIGTGPHSAIARIVARKLAPGVKFDGLSKSEWVDPASVAWILPKYIQLTDRMVAIYEEMQGR